MNKNVWKILKQHNLGTKKEGTIILCVIYRPNLINIPIKFLEDIPNLKTVMV